MEPIRQSEGLWRDVYRERQKKALNRPLERRVVHPHAQSVFGSPKRPNPAISTNLYDRVSLEYATAEGDRRAAGVEGSKGIQGWLVITVADASRKRRQVVQSPQDDNPYHADIILPDEHAENWEDMEVHVREFLRLSRWQGRASPVDADPQPVQQ